MLHAAQPANTRPWFARSLAVAAVGALGLAACGGSSDGTAAAPTFEGAWARTSPSSATVGAAYATITSDDDDRLLSVSVDTSIAATAELHEMVAMDMGHDDEAMDDDAMDDDAMDDDAMDDDAMDDDMETPMQMQEVTDGLPLVAGEALVLEPGGYHVMLIDLAEPLETGAMLPITFTFENAGDVTIDIEVMDAAP